MIDARRARRLAGVAVLFAAVWAGLKLTGIGPARDVALEYRVLPSEAPRLVDVQIVREGSVVRSAHIEVAAGAAQVEHRVMLRRGAYRVVALAGDGKRTLRGQKDFEVPGEGVVVDLTAAREGRP